MVLTPLRGATALCVISANCTSHHPSHHVLPPLSLRPNLLQHSGSLLHLTMPAFARTPPQPHTPPHTLTHLHTLSSFSQCRDLGDTKWPRGECILLPATEQTSISGTSVNEFSWALMCCNADEVGSHHATINSLTLSTPSSLSQLAFRNMMVLKSMLVIVFKDHMTSCSAGHQ